MLRQILTTHKALAHKLAELETKIETHDEAIRSLVAAIRQLMTAPEKPPKKIEFQLREKRAAYSARGQIVVRRTKGLSSRIKIRPRTQK